MNQVNINYRHVLIKTCAAVAFVISGMLFALVITLENTNYQNNENFISPAITSGSHDSFTLQYTVDTAGTYLLEVFDAGRLRYFGAISSNTHTGSASGSFVINGLTNGAALSDGTYTYSVRQSGINYNKEWIYPRDSTTKTSDNGRWKFYMPRDVAICPVSGWVFIIFHGADSKNDVNTSAVIDKIWAITNTNNLQDHNIYSEAKSNGFWITNNFSFGNNTVANDCVGKMQFHTNGDMYVVTTNHIYVHTNGLSWSNWTTLPGIGADGELGALTLSGDPIPKVFFGYRTVNQGQIRVYSNWAGSEGTSLWATGIATRSIRSLAYSTNGTIFGKTTGGRAFAITNKGTAQEIALADNYAVTIPDSGRYGDVFFQNGTGTVWYFPVSTNDGGSYFHTTNVLIQEGGITEGKGRLYGFSSLASAGNDPNTGTLVAATYYFYRADRFTISGTYIDSARYSYGRLYMPHNIAINPVNGRIYVSDQVYNKIMALSPDGDFLFDFGETGAGESEFYRPAGIVCDSAGYIYIADHLNSRIMVYRDTGSSFQFVDVRQTGQRYWGLTYNAQTGNFYGNQIDGISRVRLLYLQGGSNTVAQSYGSYSTVNYNTALGFYFRGATDTRTCGIAVRNDGLIAVSDYNNYQLQAFNPGDTVSRSTGDQGTGTIYRGITLDPEQNIVAAAYSLAQFNPNPNVIVQYKTNLLSGDRTVLIQNSEGASSLYLGVVIDASRNMYVTRQNRTVEKWQPSESIQYGTFSVDNTVPQADITFPAEGQRLQGTINITGTVWDQNMNSYLLTYQKTNSTVIVPLASGSANTSNAVLASLDLNKIDTTGLTFTLTCSDKAGNNISRAVSIIRTINTNASSFFIISNEGGTARVGDLTVTVPPGGFEYSGNLNITEVNELLGTNIRNKSLGFLKPASRMYEVSVDSFQIIRKALTYSLVYRPESVILLNENNLAMYRYNRSAYTFDKIAAQTVTFNTTDRTGTHNSSAAETVVLFEEIAVLTNSVLTNLTVFPNPVYGAGYCRFDFTLSAPANVRVDVHTLNGMLVKTVVNEKLSAGYYQNFTWDLTGEKGGLVPNNVYIIRIVVDSGDEEMYQEEVRKIIILK